jgi:uncharacterized protein
LTQQPVLLVAGISARALAASARRAGYASIAFDAFGDLDTRALARETYILQHAIEGFAKVDLQTAITAAARDPAVAGLVYTGGFEDCPERLAAVESVTSILGTDPRALARVKDPKIFAAACAEAGLAHPEISIEAPASPSSWLIKRRGGAGGLHIRTGGALGADDYWQRRIEGRSVSLLFVRDALALTPIAWSEQWTAPSAEAPFRYGGAAGPIDGPSDVLPGLARLTAALGVRGLASADFLDSGGRYWLLEINPRPGATLDVFDEDADPLLARHLAALNGATLPPPKSRSPRASEIVYTDAAFTLPAFAWPDWAADRSRAGTSFSAGSPICTVSAGGVDVAAARATAGARADEIRSVLRGAGQ